MSFVFAAHYSIAIRATSHQGKMEAFLKIAGDPLDWNRIQTVYVLEDVRAGVSLPWKSEHPIQQEKVQELVEFLNRQWENTGQILSASWVITFAVAQDTPSLLWCLNGRHWWLAAQEWAKERDTAVPLLINLEVYSTQNDLLVSADCYTPSPEGKKTVIPPEETGEKEESQEGTSESTQEEEKEEVKPEKSEKPEKKKRGRGRPRKNPQPQPKPRKGAEPNPETYLLKSIQKLFPRCLTNDRSALKPYVWKDTVKEWVETVWQSLTPKERPGDPIRPHQGNPDLLLLFISWFNEQLMKIPMETLVEKKWLPKKAAQRTELIQEMGTMLGYRPVRQRIQDIVKKGSHRWKYYQAAFSQQAPIPLDVKETTDESSVETSTTEGSWEESIDVSAEFSIDDDEI